MKTLLTVVLCLLIFGCSNHAEEKIQVDLERVVAEAESKDQGYGRRSNIFFEDPDKDFIYPPEWENPEIAVLSRGDEFKNIHVLRHENNKGDTTYYVDTNANLDFTDEDSLHFVRQENRSVSDALVNIYPEALNTDSIAVYFQVLKIDDWRFGRISEYRTGTLNADGESFDILLRPRSKEKPVYQRAPGTVLFLDANKNGEFEDQWQITDEGTLVSSEKINITQPFLINGNTFEVSYIDSIGSQITLQTSNETEAPVRGLMAPNFQATDLEGNEHNLHSYFGKPVLLEFWSKYCPYCKEVRPDLNQLKEDYGEDLTLITMARETDRNELKEHLKENPKRGIFVLRNEEAWNTFNPITATPTFYLIDSDGTIKMKVRGSGKLEVIEETLQDLL